MSHQLSLRFVTTPFLAALTDSPDRWHVICNLSRHAFS
ncbi:MAG: hypothetical protein GQF41_3495 [Candidatus Rifleibacterium amylolyticum]|nr:MAG: hypothetical protein GQF41_3495 [Candidatus Rifleibacterium amylolyticum]